MGTKKYVNIICVNDILKLAQMEILKNNGEILKKKIMKL